MGDQEAMTMADGVGDGEGIAAADSEPALWVAEFDARLEAQERAWRRRRWWGWVRMGVGNWVVASVYLWIVEFPILPTYYGGGIDTSLILLPGLVLGPAVWLFALALSYANVRVRQAIAARRQG